MTGAQILLLKTDDTQRIRITAPGTMYFYDEAGTTAGFTWDATNSRVGIGAVSPNSQLEILNSSISGNTQLHIHNNKAGDAAVLKLEGARTTSNDTGQVVFANSGNVVARIDAKSGGDEGQLRFYTSAVGTGSTLTQAMHIDTGGNVGIGTDDPKCKLQVIGALSLANGDEDFGTHTYSSYASVVSSGEINFTVGYGGTLTASRNFVFTYQATSWKAWGCEIEMASTEGLATWKVGGYNNNSGGHNSYEENDQNAMASLTYSRSGQQNIITLGFDRTNIHPCFKVRYWQSGGDGPPRMDRVKVEIT